jgi:hypothetical protein
MYAHIDIQANMYTHIDIQANMYAHIDTNKHVCAQADRCKACADSVLHHGYGAKTHSRHQNCDHDLDICLASVGWDNQHASHALNTL